MSALSLVLLAVAAAGMAATDSAADAAPAPEWDADRGYLIACLCMGRYGNQMDQLLGALHFAKRTGRIFVAPPLTGWGKYSPATGLRTSFRPLDSVFDIAALNEYHTTITMEDFVTFFANETYNPELPWADEADRTIYCINRDAKDFEPTDCRLTSGQAKGDFWAHYGFDVKETQQISLGVTYQSSDATIQRAASAAQVVLPVFAATHLSPQRAPFALANWCHTLRRSPYLRLLVLRKLPSSPSSRS